MVERERLRELIERVEKATGPDREIDARLYLFLLDRRNEFDADDGAGARYFDFERQRRHMGWDRIKRYSASLDLVVYAVEGELPGLDWWVNSEGKAGVRSDAYDPGFSGDASTPALALISALLKALHKEPEGGK